MRGESPRRELEVPAPEGDTASHEATERCNRRDVQAIAASTSLVWIVHFSNAHQERKI
jgi:hypothetical protein